MRHEPVESRMLRDGHVRFGGRIEETGRGKPRTPRLDPTPTASSRARRKWTSFYLYVILDIFSRYVVAWTVQYREDKQVAKALIAQACEQQQIKPGTLTVHADRGSAMRSKPVAFLLADLGLTRTQNRPYTSSDNPLQR